MSSHLKQNRVIEMTKLVPHPENYRKHSLQQVNGLVSSLQRFGQGRSIVVQDGPEGYVIVAGHGVVQAAERLHWKEIRADVLPADWTDIQIKGYLVADNLHSENAEDDLDMLTKLIEEQVHYYPLDTLGTDEEALRQMLDSLGEVEEPIQEKLPERGDAPVSEISDQWAILISCKDEGEQLELLERFQEEGLSCRVLIS